MLVVYLKIQIKSRSNNTTEPDSAFALFYVFIPSDLYRLRWENLLFIEPMMAV